MYQGYGVKLKRVLQCIEKHEPPCVFHTWDEDYEENGEICDFVRLLGFRCDGAVTRGPHKCFGFYTQAKHFYHETVFDGGKEGSRST